MIVACIIASLRFNLMHMRTMHDYMRQSHATCKRQVHFVSENQLYKSTINCTFLPGNVVANFAVVS